MTDIIEISNAMLERRLAQARQEAMQWQPITTAPRDGTWIVVWFDLPLSGGRPELVKWDAYRHKGHPWLSKNGRYYEGYAVRWIPAPPSQDRTEGE